MPPAKEPHIAVLVGRGVLVVLLAAWMVVSPVRGQLYNVEHWALPAWHMFRNWGTGTTRVQFYRAVDDQLVPVERLDLLGHRSARLAGRDKNIHTPAQLNDQARRLCRALGPGTDLRVRVDEARVRGWRRVVEPRRNLCRKPVRW